MALLAELPTSPWALAMFAVVWLICLVAIGACMANPPRLDQPHSEADWWCWLLAVGITYLGSAACVVLGLWLLLG